MKLQAFNPYAGRWTRRVLEYNPYHGKDGRFTGKSGAASTVAYAGRPSLGNRKDATAAEVAYRKGAGVESPRLRQDERSHDGSRMDLSWHREASRSYGRARKLTGDARRSEREGADAQARNAEVGVRKPKPPEHRERVEQDTKKYTRGMSDGKARTQRETGAAMRADDVKFHGSARLGQDFRSETSSKSKRSHGHASRVIGLQREARRRGERDIISRPDIKMLRDSAKRYSGQEASSRQAAANDNFKAELAARRGRPRRKAAPPPAPDRQSVPQNPSKYTRSMSDGKPGRALSDVMAQRKSEDAIGGISRRERQYNQARAEASRFGRYDKTSSAKVAHAGSLYWHGQAATGYASARQAKKAGKGGWGYTPASLLSTADSNRRAAKWAESRAGELAARAAKKKRAGR